ncbi:MAG: gfo/Idh/MocA family oxidoreductase, partial [Thermoguttaceae bacterium]|nr:gfo/Idh/MocA family oxidoreductase [Thermoguttaceae bacterium]
TPPWQIATWKHAPRKTCSEYTNGEIKLVWYHGPEGMKRRSDLLQPMVGDDTTINDWGIGVAFIGEKGLVVSDYGKVLLSPKSQFESYKIDPFIPSSLGHYEEFFVAAKGGPESLCNFDYSGRLIENNLLGNLAHRAGNITLPWDPVKFTTGNADADKFLKSDYEYREGWDFVNK